MKLFFKHLSCSIKKRPLQPFIMVLTIMLAVIVCVLSLSINEFASKEVNGEQKTMYGNADVTVGINSSNQSRFMFTRTAKEILGDTASVSGAYELPVFTGFGKNVRFAVAVDFSEINQTFSFEFSEYREIYQADVNSVALVTREFAKKENLKLGDSFTATVLGYEKEYTVYAISELPFINNYELMVGINGVMRLLYNDSLLVSALGDEFKPCSTVYISFYDDANIQDGINKLKEHREFSNKTFTVVTDTVKNASSSESLLLSVYVIIAMAVCLCVAVVFCCFYILSYQRANENAVFKSVGATPWRLNLITYAEIIAYWFVGSLFAVALSYPLVLMVFSKVGFRFITPFFSVSSAIIGCAIILACSLLTAIAFTISERVKKRAVRTAGLSLTTFILFVVFFILLFVVPKVYAFTISMIAEILFLLFMFTFLPNFFKTTTSLIDRWATARAIAQKQKNIARLYAFKNAQKVSVLQNTARLWVLLLIIVLSVSTSLISAETILADNRVFIKGDYIVSNATERCAEKIESVDGVDGAYSLYMVTGEMEKNRTVFMFSSNHVQAFDNLVALPALPQGNQAYISLGYAKMMEITAGDKLSVTVGKDDIELEICGVLQTTVNLIVFNSEHFNFPYNAVTVVGKAGGDLQKLYSDLSSALALEMTTVISLNDYTKHKIATSEVYLNCAYVLLPFVLSFAIIGILDNLLESYRSRKEEFELFVSAGMSKGQVRKMIFYEILYLFAFGLTVGVVSLLPFTIMLDAGFSTFCYPYIFSLFGI